MSEGSFFVKRNNDGCFQLKQRLHANLFEAFKLVFNTNRKVSIKACTISLLLAPKMIYRQ